MFILATKNIPLGFRWLYVRSLFVSMNLLLFDLNTLVLTLKMFARPISQFFYKAHTINMNAY